MEESKKPDNDPVSAGADDLDGTENKKSPDQGNEADSSSKKKDSSREPEENSSEPISPEETGNEGEAEKKDQDVDLPDQDPGEIRDSSEPYRDPHDPDGIYPEYDEFSSDDEYAPVADRMPERPDDPHHPGSDENADRAREEKTEEKSSKQDTSKRGKNRSSEAKKNSGDDDDDEDYFLDEREKELGGRMSFLDHLDELRKRIFHALMAIIVTFVGAWIFREPIFRFLSAPIKDVVDQLVVLRPTEPFTVYLKVSFAAAIFFAVPYIMFQVWLFIAPGLYRREKIYALPFLFASTTLFVLGGTFAYYIILPPALNFLLNTFGSEFKAVISAVEYYDFELIILVGMGAIFQLPVVVAFLSMFGMVTPKFLWKNFKYAFLLITIIAAVVSPTTDPMNLLLWSGPMVVLYTFSIGISWIFKKRRDKKNDFEEDI